MVVSTPTVLRRRLQALAFSRAAFPPDITAFPHHSTALPPAIAPAGALSRAGAVTQAGPLPREARS